MNQGHEFYVGEVIRWVALDQQPRVGIVKGMLRQRGLGEAGEKTMLAVVRGGDGLYDLVSPLADLRTINPETFEVQEGELLDYQDGMVIVDQGRLSYYRFRVYPVSPDPREPTHLLRQAEVKAFHFLAEAMDFFELEVEGLSTTEK